MAESQPYSIYGIHDITIFSRSTWLPEARMRVLGTVTADFSGEFAEHKGGSQLFNWNSKVNDFNSTLEITSREISADILDITLPGTSTEVAADAAGATTDFANKNGTSLLDAATGVATVTVTASTGAAELKEGWYVIKAATTTAVDLYAFSSSNFSRGTNETMEDDDGKITAAPITIVDTGATIEVPNFGLTLTSGSGTVLFVVGDTAIFYVQKPHGGWFSQTIGETPIDFSDVGVHIASETEKGVTSMLLLYRVTFAGQPLVFPERDYAEMSLNAAVQFDSVENGVGIFKRSLPE